MASLINHFRGHPGQGIEGVFSKERTCLLIMSDSESGSDMEGGYTPAVEVGESESLERNITAPSLNAKFQCRMYENQYPEVGDLVMVTVKRIAEMGAFVSLMEYNNIEGMVLLSELSRRRIRSVHRLIRVGKTEVVVVLRVDKDKGYIDLSKHRVRPEEAEKFEEKYNKSKTVHSILRHVAEKHDMELEELYQDVGWPLYRKFGHAFEAFKTALNEPDRLWEALPEPVEDFIKTEIIQSIVRRLTPQKLKIRADVEVACFDYEGIDAVKRALTAGEAASTEEIQIKAKLVAPPLYVLMTQCMDKAKGLEVMNKAIEQIEEVVKAANGQVVVKMKPKAVSETDDKVLADLMKKSEMDNAEVSGDEDHSEL
jgi:translation initiation factor 2 subunit 1